MRDLMNRVEKIWCEQMHSAILWPIHGKYRCAKCHREYPATFERHRTPQPAVVAPGEAAESRIGKCAS